MTEGSNTQILPNFSFTYASTRLLKETYRHVWKIEDFLNSPQKVEESIRSSVFPVGDGTRKWYLELYFKGDTLNKEFVSLYLKSCNKLLSVSAVVEIGILGKDDVKMNSMVYETLYFGVKENNLGNPYLINYSTLRSDLSYLPDENLVVFCNITTKELVTNSVHQLEIKAEDKITDLIENMTYLMKEAPHSDISVKCGESVFKCHRALLSARSRTMSTMINTKFEGDSTEGDLVLHSFFDEAVFSDVISYLYTDTAPNLKNHPRELLGASTFYDLRGLNVLCQIELIKSLSLDTCVNYLLLAKKNDANHLKREALECIKRNWQYVSKSYEWKSLLGDSSNLSLVNDLMKRVAATL